MILEGLVKLPGLLFISHLVKMQKKIDKNTLFAHFQNETDKQAILFTDGSVLLY